VFFIIPCVDIYEKIDMRVRNFSVPPQEVIMGWSYASCHLELVDIFHIAIGIQEVQRCTRNLKCSRKSNNN
jgi:hypothetical protein